MQLTKLVLHNGAFNDLRKSPEVMDFAEGVARQRAVNDKINVKLLKRRGSVIVQCGDKKTAKENSRKNTLIKAYKK